MLCKFDPHFLVHIPSPATAAPFTASFPYLLVNCVNTDCLTSREGTPLQPVRAHHWRPSGSNLKPQSSLKPLATSVGTDSPSCGTPKEASGRLMKKRSRVTFNPAVSFTTLPTPSTCSGSGSGDKQRCITRMKVSMPQRILPPPSEHLVQAVPKICIVLLSIGTPPILGCSLLPRVLTDQAPASLKTHDGHEAL